MAVNTLEAQKYADGVELDYTPSGAVTAGTPIELGGTLGLCGVPNSDIAANAKGTLCIQGVFSILKVTGALAVGDKVGWDDNGTPVGGSTTGALTATVAAWDFPVGTVVEAAASGGTTAKVLINRWRNIDIVESLPAQAHIADVAAATQDALTDNSTGTPATTLAVGPTGSQGILVDSTTGTADLTFAALAGTGADALSAAEAAIANNNFAECVAELNKAKADILALNEWAEDSVASLNAQLAKVKVDVAADKAKINAVLVALETSLIIASV